MKCFSKSGKEIELGDKITWYSWRYKGMIIGEVRRMEMRTRCNWTKDPRGAWYRDNPRDFIKLGVWVNGEGGTTQKKCYVGNICRQPEFVEKY